MGLLSSIFGPIMRVCYRLLNGNYGLAIILFTLLTKIILLPLSIWVQKNSIKMVKMEPELNQIKIDHFNDKDTIAERTNDLYKKNKYHASLSLIPLIIQLVLLLGVVDVIYHPLTSVLKIDESIASEFTSVAMENDETINPSSSSIEMQVVKQIKEGKTDNYYLIQERMPNEDINSIITRLNDLDTDFLGINLLWIPSIDLGISLLVPFLAALSSWLLSYSQNKMNVLQVAQSKVGNYITMAISVGLSLYLGFFVFSGVVIYWIASNLLAILQQWILNKFIDPSKYVNWELLNKTSEELNSLNEAAKKNKLDPELKKRSKEDYKKFLSIGNKHLVFYSESSGFYKYYKGIVEYILNNSNIPLHYITSDPNDIIFSLAKGNSQIKPYYIDSQRLITLFMKMDADVVCMTMPEIEKYQYKRSYVRKDITYIYLQHCLDSLNLTMREGCIDYYDVVFSSDKSQSDEFKALEKLRNIENQIIVDTGYPLLDELASDYEKMKSKKLNKEGKKTVLIAPSWQKDNIVDSCLDEILDSLKDKDFNIIVRPHPQHVRHMPERMEALKEKYSNNSNIEIQTDFSSNKTIYLSDAIITDWSSIGYEFAFSTLKPVLFINTPMKIMNPNYKDIDVEPLNIALRDKIGLSVDLDKLDKVPTYISDLLDNKAKYSKIIKEYRDENCFNFGHSAFVCGDYIIKEVLTKIAIRKKDENV